jgi:hypothetical protein
MYQVGGTDLREGEEVVASVHARGPVQKAIAMQGGTQMVDKDAWKNTVKEGDNLAYVLAGKPTCFCVGKPFHQPH